MAVFRFRLQTFLNVKEQMEKSVKNELGIAIKNLRLQQDALERIKSEISSQADEYRRDGSCGTTLLKLKQRAEYIKWMKKMELKQIERVNEERRNVDKIRERLVEIMKEKKILEKLREKELTLFRQEQEKAGQALADELVSYREFVKTEGKTLKS